MAVRQFLNQRRDSYPLPVTEPATTRDIPVLRNLVRELLNNPSDRSTADFAAVFLANDAQPIDTCGSEFIAYVLEHATSLYYRQPLSKSTVYNILTFLLHRATPVWHLVRYITTILKYTIIAKGHQSRLSYDNNSVDSCILFYTTHLQSRLTIDEHTELLLEIAVAAPSIPDCKYITSGCITILTNIHAMTETAPNPETPYIHTTASAVWASVNFIHTLCTTMRNTITSIEHTQEKKRGYNIDNPTPALPDADTIVAIIIKIAHFHATHTVPRVPMSAFGAIITRQIRSSSSAAIFKFMISLKEDEIPVTCVDMAAILILEPRQTRAQTDMLWYMCTQVMPTTYLTQVYTNIVILYARAAHLRPYTPALSDAVIISSLGNFLTPTTVELLYTFPTKTDHTLLSTAITILLLRFWSQFTKTDVTAAPNMLSLVYNHLPLAQKTPFIDTIRASIYKIKDTPDTTPEERDFADALQARIDVIRAA